ncbi:MAG: ABC transporter substrate-binding protein [Dehalococcoidia bacterium]
MATRAYWSRAGGAKTSRRRILQGIAAGTAGGIFAAACGGSGDEQEDLSSVLAPRATTAPDSDPFANVQRGGILNATFPSDPPALDPYVQAATYTKGFATYVYSRLFKYKGGPGIVSTEAPPTGDLAQSAESTPDGLSWTIKLRDNIKFHNVAPVNGRAVTTDDVKYSWERATGEKGINRSQLEFIEKAEFPDPKTIVFTLKEPNAAFLEVMADLNLLWIMPREADGGFDTATTAIGSGPWIMENYTPSVGFKFKRNPEWHDSGFPLMDGVNVSIVKEYASGLAQFQSGGLDTYGVNATDIVDLKKQLPETQLVGQLSVSLYQFYFDGNPNAPWRDERVRQAMSMALDRDAILDLAYNVKNLRAGGIEVKDVWNNILPAAHSRFWLDPKSEAHGETGRFFKYDPEGAKKLLAEAGYPNGFEAKYQYSANVYGNSHNLVAQASAEFLNRIGIKTNIEAQDYNAKYYTQTYRGNFDGIAFGPESSFPEPGSYPLRQFTPNPLNKSRADDPVLEKLARDQQRELDEGKRRDMFHEIQRHHAGKMYLIPSSFGSGYAWIAYQPTLRNAADFATPIGYASGGEQFPFWWKSQ